MCFVTTKILLESKGKGFGLHLPCFSCSFFSLKCNFSFSISMRSFVSSLIFFIIFLISHVLIFLFSFLFVFLSLILPFLTLFCLVLIFSQHPIFSFLCFQLYSVLSSFSRLNLSSRSAFPTLVLFSCSNLNFSISTCLNFYFSQLQISLGNQNLRCG